MKWLFMSWVLAAAGVAQAGQIVGIDGFTNIILFTPTPMSVPPDQRHVYGSTLSHTSLSTCASAHSVSPLLSCNQLLGASSSPFSNKIYASVDYIPDLVPNPLGGLPGFPPFIPGPDRPDELYLLDVFTGKHEAQGAFAGDTTRIHDVAFNVPDGILYGAWDHNLYQITIDRVQGTATTRLVMDVGFPIHAMTYAPVYDPGYWSLHAMSGNTLYWIDLNQRKVTLLATDLPSNSTDIAFDEHLGSGRVVAAMPRPCLFPGCPAIVSVNARPGDPHPWREIGGWSSEIYGLAEVTIPEPSSVSIVALGLLFVVLVGWRKSRTYTGQMRQMKLSA